jgi:hypothetical protein
MTERGGTTTQSGIFYQNSVSALYLGRLCDATARPDSERAVKVRVEAPDKVDDTVVTFADGHRTYIQAKEKVRVSQRPWLKLWKDFDQEFRSDSFRRGEDRLFLCVGESRDEHYHLKGLCERAARSRSYDEWWGRLNDPQKALVEKIEPLKTGLSGEAEALAFFGHIDVEVWSLQHIEQSMVPYWMPESNKPRWSLFSLLRDRVGGEARHRGWFTSRPLRECLRTRDEVLLVSPPDIGELRASVRACGSLLKQHKHTFGNTERRLERGIVGEIICWAQEAPDKDNVAVLLDGAGMGKTVVMRDVLCGLEDEGTTVLAIKADQQLSGVATRNDLQERLDLPERVERVVGRLATLDRVIVLIDQIDALSLSMARDYRALNVVLEMVAKLRDTPGVRVLFSCRAFDLSNDPRLDRVEVARRFSLPQLSDEEIESILCALDVDLARLSGGARDLLSTPLHLDLFSRILAAREPSPDSRRGAFGISTLQDLYALLWHDVVLAITPGSPRASEREEVLCLLTERMNRDQRISAPRSNFTKPETEYLEPAANWLASAGILIPSANEWSFLHQTFFDYCYAKRFVEEGRQLSETVLNGDQGLFARPQLVQVLSYLRGSDDPSYLRELQSLLNAEDLRVHMRLLLLGWVGALSAPTDDEWLLARRMIVDAEIRHRVLVAMQGNPGWFAHMRGGQIQDMLTENDEVLDVEIIPYLTSMIDVEQAAVIELVRPFAGRSERWDRRLRLMLTRISDWHTYEAVQLFERTLRETPTSNLGRVYELHEVVKAFPQEGCRLIRLVLDRALEDHMPKADGAPWFSQSFLNRFPISDSVLDDAMKEASEAEPKLFIEQVLPWLERAVRFTNEPGDDCPFFASDWLSRGWHGGGLDDTQESLIQAVVAALSVLARTEPVEFRQVAARLAGMPYKTPQQLLAHVYQRVPELYAEDALRFLTGDTRRLKLGDSEQYDTRLLIKVIYPFLSADQRAELEDSILSYNPILRYRGIEGLRSRGLAQLYLLQDIPAEHLSKRGASYLRELERKFRGVRASENPPMLSTMASVVGSPIQDSALVRMSDEAWLRAMRKYSGATRHKDLHKGGAGELSSVLSKQTKENPQRFYALALRAPSDVDGSYARAFIDGLAESDGPDEWLFDMVERFAGQQGRDIKRTIAWALEKRADGGLSDEMLDLLERTARAPVGEDEIDQESSGQGPHSIYINSSRGASLRALMRALHGRASNETKQKMWDLLEFASSDPSTPMRAGAIEELLYLLYEDRERAIALFERAMEGHPNLLCFQPGPEFLYYGTYKHFSRMKPFVQAMMDEEKEECRQRGAELACIAAISSASALGSEANLAAARELAQGVANGPAVLRRGAARVYAHNLNGERSAYCARELSQLLNDEDDKVRDYAAQAFYHTCGTHSPGLREFVEDFAASRALRAGEHEFSEYLWKYGLEDPAWTLLVLQIVLENDYEQEPHYSLAGGNLVRLALRLYTDPTADHARRAHAMDIFDGLMERYTYEAQSVLDEWDRK